ncbi:hypothetical protein CLD06_01835 [Wolbachia endosymbiont of Drosophila subpulchrella]|nr:hypothetical protein CLD06_01835 [Wolbachia endosymbiont of Drosophila subpulchrella]
MYSFWQQPLEIKNLLDKLRQPPYHETEAIYLSSLYRLNDKKTHVSGVSCLIFCTMCTLCLYQISRFLPIQAEIRL